MRDASTDDMQARLNLLWLCYTGSKEEFMLTIPGVTADIRVEPAVNFPWQEDKDETSYYCSVVAKDLHGFLRIYEVYSYDEGPWYCKS